MAPKRVTISLTPGETRALWSAMTRADSEWEAEEFDEGMGRLRTERRRLEHVFGKVHAAAGDAKVDLT